MCIDPNDFNLYTENDFRAYYAEEREVPTPLRIPTDTPRSHDDLLNAIGGVREATGVSGRRFHYLMGPAVLLNQALLQYGMRFLLERGYVPVQPPTLMRRSAMRGVAQLEDFRDTLYEVSNDNKEKETEEEEEEEEGDTDPLCLIATSEQPLCAMHRNERIPSDRLPLRYAGISPCYRREAGSRADARGIFRVHQFDKVEQFCMTKAEDASSSLRRVVDVSQAFYRSLGLPHRTVRVVSGHLSAAASEKIDLEAWFPSQGRYRELVSASNCTDYQSRSMNVRCVPSKKDASKGTSTADRSFVCMINATLVAGQRTLCCVLENYQTETGVRVPTALVPYVGTTHIPFET